MFAWLEGTGLAVWVGESAWGYPTMLAAHALGLAISVGVSLVVDLRVLGVVRELPYSVFPTLFKLVWTGLLINAASGVALFTSQATTFATSIPFLIKLSAVLVAVVAGLMLQRQVERARAVRNEAKAERSAYPLAILSIVGWIAAICAGRLIAYF